MLSSTDFRDQKDALQRICESLEAGSTINLESNLLLAKLIAKQRNSNDAAIRRWFYKYVGLRRDITYAPTILDAIAKEDTETSTWIVGALVSIFGIAEARDQLKKHSVNESLIKNASIYGAYFQPHTISNNILGHLTTGDDEILNHWASFLNSRWRSQQLYEYNKHLTTDSNATVSEFSVWSVSKSTGLFIDTNINPDLIFELPSQVRRWALHLIAADEHSRLSYADLIWSGRESEPDERVREGLASGLVSQQLSLEWFNFIKEWAEEETSERVSKVLSQATSLTDISKGKAFFITKEAENKITLEKHKMIGIPRIESSKKELIYFIALDTVSFSKESDSDQISIVGSFLDALFHDRDLAALNPSSIIPLLTGDGIILGIKGAGNSLTPVIPPFITAVLSRRIKPHSVSLWV